MTKKLVGLFASVALLGSGMALADDKVKDQQAQGSEQLGGDAIGGSGTQGQGQMGGSGSQGQMGGSQGQMGEKPGQMGSSQTASAQPMGEKEVTGTVVKSSSTLLHLRTDNGIIPIKVGKDIKIDDPSVKRVRDLKEGQQVRASFDIQGTDNVAKSISLDTNMGGSGLDSDTGINQQPGDVGGSGMDQPIDQDLGGSGNLGGDLGGSGDVGGSGDQGGNLGGDVGGSGDKDSSGHESGKGH
ncbi:hypothetical protein [Archangium sp.]|uniref:hypothetical protein n=1 Tax=Archangium sp. TaxID=1872627 RepID=UPI00286A4F59|nr:hypothetical protein [Archangium sp.]